MKPYWKIGLGLLLVLLFIVGLWVLDARPLITRFLENIENLGIWGAIIYIFAYIVATVFMLPGMILTLGAGFIFGFARGLVIISIGSTLGAAAAFVVSRYFARNWVEQKVRANPKFHALDQAVGKEGWKIVLLMRLSPILPFNLLNYAFGVTRVSLRHYFFATWLGMFPATLFYVYLGSIAGSLATLGEQARQKTPLEWAYYGFGLAAALAVVIFLTRLGRKVLKENEIPA